MTRFLAVTLAAVPLIGCSSPHYGMTFSSADAAEALQYPGHTIDPNHNEVAIDVNPDLRFRYSDRTLATAHIPRGWTPRVQCSAAQDRDGRAYHWASAQFETPAHTKAQIDLKFFGDETLFLIVNGRGQQITPGAEFDVTPGPDGFELISHQH